MSAYPSLISPLMNSQGLITTSALNTDAQTALASGVAANAKADTLLATALQTNGPNYVGLPAAGIVVKDAADRNLITLAADSGVIFTNTTVRAAGIGTGVNCFQNTDASFSVQANGNCTVNELTYTSLNGPTNPTPTLAEVLASGNDGGTRAIVGISQVTANDSLQILKDADQPELGTYTLTSDPATGFNVGGGASLTANALIGAQSLQIFKDINQPELGNYSLVSDATGIAAGGGASLSAITLIGSSPNGTCIQNADATFKADYTGNVYTTGVQLPNSTSILSGGNGIVSFDGANLAEVTDITTSGNIINTNAGGTLSLSTNNIKVYTDNKVSQVGAIDSSGNSYLQNYYLWGVGAGDFAITNDKNILTTGEITCSQLNCSTFNPPIATPTLAQVLAAGADGNQVDITNCGSVAASGFTTAGNVTCALVNGVAPEFKPTYNYFVSKGGNDTDGLGSILSPYLTIQKAISVCEAFTDGVPRVVNVAAGAYTENLTLTKSRISIVGQGQSSRPDVGTAIYGTITITIASGNSDLNNNNIYFSNFLINGLFEDNTSGTNVPHRVFFDRCQLYANDRVLYLHPAGDYRAFVSNCVISNDNTGATNPVVECYSSSTGMVSFTSNQITSKGASQNVFKLSGSCRIDTYAQNILTSDSVGTNVAIAIFVHNSTAVISLGQNAFVYSSAGAKRNSDTASGIFMNAASAGGSLVIANNFFSLTGLPNGQNAVQNNSAAGVVIYGGNISTSSAAGTSAHDISGSNNVNKFAMTAVQ